LVATVTGTVTVGVGRIKATIERKTNPSPAELSTHAAGAMSQRTSRARVEGI